MWSCILFFSSLAKHQLFSGYDTKLHLMVSLQFWSFGHNGVPFHYHYFQIHFDGSIYGSNWSLKIIDIGYEYIKLYNCVQANVYRLMEKVQIKKIEWNIGNIAMITIKHFQKNQILALNNKKLICHKTNELKQQPKWNTSLRKPIEMIWLEAACVSKPCIHRTQEFGNDDLQYFLGVDFS